MTICLLCSFPRFQSAQSCSICGSDHFFTVEESIPGNFALRMAAEGRTDVAWKSLEEAIASGRGTALDCLHLAWLAYGFRDDRAVEIWCHESERLDGASPEPHVVMATVFHRDGRWPEALEEYDAALRRARLSPERRALLEQQRAACQRQIPEW